MREAAVVDDISVGLLRLKILSHDGDTFYAGCTLNHPLIEVESMDSVSVPCIVGLSDSDRSAYFSWPSTEKGCFSMIIRCNRNPGEVQATGAEGCWRLGNVSCDPFGGVFINLDLGIPGGNVLLEVRGARRQLRNQDEFIYALEYPKNVHSCAPSDPCVLSWGLVGQFRCSARHHQTMDPQPIDSVIGGLSKLLSTRIPAEAGSSTSPESLSDVGQFSCGTPLCLSISVQQDKVSYNIACTPNACCWVHVSELNFKCPVVLLSLQHARCRIVVTQIPVGPL